MILSGIISISGRSGLYKVIAQGKNNIIVESLEDKKRFPAYSTDRISALEDISIYTYEEDKALAEIFDAIHTKENGAICISHKEADNKLSEYLESVLPNYDKERVYASDIKKIFMWYNLLHKAGELKLVEDKDSSGDENSTETEEKKEAKKAPKAKVSAETKPKAVAKEKPAAKSTAGKKVVAPKVGTSRGK